MKAIECHAGQQQWDMLYLMASISARRFYEKLGYQIVRPVDHEVDGVSVPMIHMEKFLTTI